MPRQKKELTVHNEGKSGENTMQDAAVVENKGKVVEDVRADEFHDYSGSFGTATPDTSREAMLEAQKKYDNVMVTGKFINQRAPGNSVKLTYHKYATDPVKWYEFKHNQVYTIPRGFADQINEHYAKLTFAEGQRQGGKEVVTKSDGSFTDLAPPQRTQIYAFVPVSF